MAISRNTPDFIRRTKLAQEKTDDHQSAGCDGARRRGILKAAGCSGCAFSGVESNAQSRFDFREVFVFPTEGSMASD
jgi:hypothetical protein